MQIIFEDNHLLVVAKPVNVPVQADQSQSLDFLSQLKDFIKERDNKPGNVFLGLVHRLDRPVGGTMVFAKTSKAASRLSDQMRRNYFEKTYLAVVRGAVSQKQTIVKNYLKKNRAKNIVTVHKDDRHGAKYAELSFTHVDTVNNLSLVKVDLVTGRSHQIRVQLAHLGLPIFGDHKYGKNEKKGTTPALWSYGLEFMHPVSNVKITFTLDPTKTFPWNRFERGLG